LTITAFKNNSAIIRTPVFPLSHESPTSFIACGSIVSQQSPDIPVRLSHRNPPVYLLTVTFPIIFYVFPRLLCRGRWCVVFITNAG
ncbi:hypothetical protein ACFHU4_26115, partial [Escherichia coli]|uniref:hypothetical protein n=1 Tax=Escherichia coli TaxID=562 RepID=UPI00374005E3